jgi:hypothetical protein
LGLLIRQHGDDQVFEIEKAFCGGRVVSGQGHGFIQTPEVPSQLIYDLFIREICGEDGQSLELPSALDATEVTLISENKQLQCGVTLVEWTLPGDGHQNLFYIASYSSLMDVEPSQDELISLCFMIPDAAVNVARLYNDIHITSNITGLAGEVHITDGHLRVKCPGGADFDVTSERGDELKEMLTKSQQILDQDLWTDLGLSFSRICADKDGLPTWMSGEPVNSSRMFLFQDT